MTYKVYTFQYECSKFLYGLGKGHQQYNRCLECLGDSWLRSERFMKWSLFIIILHTLFIVTSDSNPRIAGAKLFFRSALFRCKRTFKYIKFHVFQTEWNITMTLLQRSQLKYPLKSFHQILNNSTSFQGKKLKCSIKIYNES